MPDPAFPDDTIPANSTLLLDMIADIGTNRLEYIYDFGDHWSHTIKLVKPLPAVSGIAYPLLISAARPPPCPRALPAEAAACAQRARRWAVFSKRHPGPA